ncbi:3-hydroxyacyl-CoA dehydrogenase [Modicisalibacter muralis]|uniref:3-hydroxyacyl-CoA dehydrogenase n=1 Tax=Modicisalibacter muralis TaxID=119000 RepID=A0A1G9KMI2_9GAMM|nr:3-hydroxyacyl-CoA dehydrogenase NAD-binding domain-containing protein [Halomonas muralis]SDL50902.1 3-hydroxyacyl-CoA dehydrogenase [Halomonas muralis]
MTRPTPEDVSHAAIIGTGLIGSAWAALFLAHGIEVLAIDPADGAANRLRQTIATMAPMLEELGLVTAAADFARVEVVAEPGPELEGVQFVQENAPENLALKQAILADLERWLGPSAIIASSTSALKISDIQAGCRHPERCIAGHPINPPHLMPLVEVSGGESSDATTLDWAMRFYAYLGKKPVRLRRDIEGHIAGRLGAALWREAVSLVDQGVASVADIDAAVVYGPGLRWATMGPHLTYHLGGGEGGIRHYLAHLGDSQQRRWESLGRPTLSAELKDRIADGVLDEARERSIEELALERDRKLVAAIKAVGESRG